MGNSERRLLPFATADKIRAAKVAAQTTADVQRAATNLINDIQVLVFTRPFAILILARWAAWLRRTGSAPPPGDRLFF